MDKYHKKIIVFSLLVTIFIIGCNKNNGKIKEINMTIDNNEVKSENNMKYTRDIPFNFEKCKNLPGNDYDIKLKRCVEYVMSLGDPEMCFDISPGASECLENFAVTKLNSTICEKYKNKFIGVWSDLCNVSVEKEKGNLAVCDRLMYSFTNKDKVLCRAETLGDESICYDNKENIDFCLRMVAKFKKSDAVCNKISNSNDKIYCFSEVAKQKVDEKICNNIPNEDFMVKILCVSAVAKITLNDSVCNLIFDLDGEKICNLETKEEIKFWI